MRLLKHFPEIPRAGYWYRELRAGRTFQFLRAQRCPRTCVVKVEDRDLGTAIVSVYAGVKP